MDLAEKEIQLDLVVRQAASNRDMTTNSYGLYKLI